MYTYFITPSKSEDIGEWLVMGAIADELEGERHDVQAMRAIAKALELNTYFQDIVRVVRLEKVLPIGGAINIEDLIDRI